MNNGYSICFNKWALDKNIKNELRLLVIISSLTAETGYCFASNKYLAEVLDETEVSISNKIKNLEQNNYIDIEYEKRGCEITSRKIRLKNILIDDYKIFYSTIKKNFKDNNISINNTSINKKENIIINNNIKEKTFFENKKLNDLFIEFLKQRKKLKAINSERAINQLLQKLEPYDDLVKEQMIEESLVNSWKSVFPIKKQKENKKDNWWNKYEN